VGIDVTLCRRDRPGTGPRRESTRPIALVYGGDEFDSLLELVWAHGRMPMLDRLDPVRSVVLTSADMPQLVTELDAAQALADTDTQRQYLATVRALARVCAGDKALELHFDGD
jgi:hypothetical protein